MSLTNYAIFLIPLRHFANNDFVENSSSLRTSFGLTPDLLLLMYS